MDKGEPVLRFLGSTSTQGAAFSQPSEGALNNPTAGRELGFTRNRAAFKQGFVATTTMFDMGHIAFLLDKVVDISKIIAFVQAQVLCDALRVRARHDNRKDDLIDQPLVMNVRAGNIGRQRRTTAIDQNMDFAAAFATVNRTFAGVCAAQRRRTRRAVDSLPSPVDTPSLPLEFDKRPHQTLKHPHALPFLKSLMNRGAASAKPIAVYGLPLATCPQHIPYPIDDPPIFGSLAA